MKTATRFPFERLALMDRLIRAGEYPNARTLAERLEVSRRTVLRDIEMARDRLGMPLVFDAKRRGFTYGDPTYRLSFTALTKSELAALETARLALEPFRGLPDGPNLMRATSKVVSGLVDQPPVAVEDLGPSRSFRFSAESRIDPDRFVAIIRAINDRHRVAIRYYSASRDAEADREVDPYHLVSIDGRWFLIAFCHLRAEVLMFAPSRIRSWACDGRNFDPPRSFRVREYLARSFGMLRGGDDELYEVRLRFRGEAVRYVREQTWHPSQTCEPTADDGLELRLELSHLREVERWVLSWGADCLVLDPPELRERVARSLARAAAQYFDGEPETTSHRPEASSSKSIQPNCLG